MRKYKTKITAAAVIVAALAAAWFYDGGLAANTGGSGSPAVLAAAESLQQHNDASETHGYDAAMNEAVVSDAAEGYATVEAAEAEPPADAAEISETLPEPQIVLEEAPQTSAEAGVPPIAQTAEAMHPENRVPADPADKTADDAYFYITLSVRVDMILYNMHLLNSEKHELVPDDGVIFPPTLVRAYEGESVFNVLQREMRRSGIHMASRFTPLYNSAYVEAIHNLYEFDVGPLSGWMYRVNGRFPNFGASRYVLSADDVVDWLYTVDLGRDLGVDGLSGGQNDA